MNQSSYAWFTEVQELRLAFNNQGVLDIFLRSWQIGCREEKGLLRVHRLSNNGDVKTWGHKV